MKIRTENDFRYMTYIQVQKLIRHIGLSINSKDSIAALRFTKSSIKSYIK